jgi:hypothetical protein
VVEENTTASLLGGANDDIKSNESQSNRHMPQPCACVTLSLALPSASSALRPPANTVNTGHDTVHETVHSITRYQSLKLLALVLDQPISMRRYTVQSTAS